VIRKLLNLMGKILDILTRLGVISSPEYGTLSASV
jgi:hypothetical protein